MELEFLGAAGEVTGSMYLLTLGDSKVLLECGLIQGGRKSEARNRDPLPFDVNELDAVVISHAHIDHSGRLPLLVRRGYTGPIYAQNATRALCRIMLPDSGYLNEKDAEWENKRRRERGKSFIEPLYTREDAQACMSQFESFAYEKPFCPVEGLTVTFFDAGHILGSTIVELRYEGDEGERILVFSGDLGFRDSPVMDDPRRLTDAHAVLMESTYGDRCHRAFDETIREIGDVFDEARASQGNVLIPAFTVGRTQDLLYLMAEHYSEWNIDDWHIFIDSPMGIDATELYAEYRHLYGAKLFGPDEDFISLERVHMTRTTEESMVINQVKSGAIILAGSGMMTGGRIHHHLKNNIWRPECHLVIVGYQAHGSLGRRIVDGVESIRLWGQTYPVRAKVHTIGGLSAHADQQDLIDWYTAFETRPPLYLVHGESRAQEPLAERLRSEYSAPVTIARSGERIRI